MDTLPPAELETVTALKRLGNPTSAELAKYLGIRPATVSRRLQELRAKGYAGNNGKRGLWCRWWSTEPTPPTPAVGRSVPAGLLSTAIEVHKFLRTTPGWHSPQQIAAMMRLEARDVAAACRELVARGVMRELGGHFDIAPSRAVEPADAEDLIDNWLRTLSDSARSAVSVNDRARLAQDLRAWVGG